jgi:predicted oxidoreductase
MRTVLSNNGPEFSRLVWGVMKWGVWGHRLDTQGMLRLIEEGIELGVSTFDHADIYGDYSTEAEFGAALKLQPGLRSKMQLVSKCGICMRSPQRPHHWVKSYNTSKAHILHSVDRSLQNLHTDYLDLLLIHRPSPLLDAAEVAEAFEALLNAGKVRYFGVSNFTPTQFTLLHAAYPLVTNQIEASLLKLDPFLDGTLDQAQQLQLKPMAWGPLGSGKLFGEDFDGQAMRIHKVAQFILNKQQQEYGLDQLLLAWLMKHPAGILPVLGTAKTARVQAALAAQEIHLDEQDWFALWEASIGEEVA